MIDPSTLHIVYFPESILRAKAQPVNEVDDLVRRVAERMFDLMQQAEGVGLAAPQVGLPWRMFVTEAHEGHPRRVFINPRLHDLGDDYEVAEEGCLSLPNVRVNVRRSLAAGITATDLEGAEFTLHDQAMIARIWQHEFDHLDGVLIIDKMGPMDRLANRKAIKELKVAAQ